MVNGQNVSVAKHIGGKYISGKVYHFGCKPYWLKTYQLQSHWGDENGFSKAAGELQTVF
jgi:hypothetical protein